MIKVGWLDGTDPRRRWMLVLCLTLAVASSLMRVAESGPRRVTDAWSVTAYPFPPSCRAYGVEDLTYVSHPFSAPFTGHLDVQMSNFVGDWDVQVWGSDERIMGAGRGDENPEHLRIPVSDGAELSILACNLGGGTTADLSLVFTRMRRCELELRCPPKGY